MKPIQVNGTRYPEKEMLSIFLGTCDAVAAMHHYETGPSTSYPPPSPDPSSTSTSPVLTSSSKRVRRNEEHKEDEEEDEDDETRLTRGGEGEALIGSLEGAKAELEEEEGHRATTESHAPSLSTHTNERMAQPWAHRDIKPVRSLFPSSPFSSDQPLTPNWIGEHYDSRRRSDTDSNGLWIRSTGSNIDTISFCRIDSARYRRRTLFDAIPSSRVIRRQCSSSGQPYARADTVSMREIGQNRNRPD